MSDENCALIVQAGGLDPLIALSRSKNLKVQRLALETISNLGPLTPCTPHSGHPSHRSSPDAPSATTSVMYR